MTKATTGKPTCIPLVTAAKTTANSVSGTLTASIRKIEQYPRWQGNKDLRHWHQMFSQARQCLITQPPERATRNEYAELQELLDDDTPRVPAPTWPTLLGMR